MVFHEARVDPGLVTRLGRRHITGSTGGLFQGYTFLKCSWIVNILSINLQKLFLRLIEGGGLSVFVENNF